MQWVLPLPNEDQIIEQTPTGTKKKKIIKQTRTIIGDMSVADIFLS